MTRDKAYQDIKHLRDTIATDSDNWAYDEVLERLQSSMPIYDVRSYVVEQRAIMTGLNVRLAYLNMAMVLGRVKE